jgi:hypothetical protein
VRYEEFASLKSNTTVRVELPPRTCLKSIVSSGDKRWTREGVSNFRLFPPTLMTLWAEPEGIIPNEFRLTTLSELRKRVAKAQKRTSYSPFDV